MPFTDGVRAIGLGQTINMDRVNIERFQLSEQGGRRGRSCNSDGNLTIKAMSIGRVHQENLHSRCPIIVCDTLSIKYIPYEVRVNLAQTDVRCTNGSSAPGEAPTIAVEHGQCPEIDACAIHSRFDDFG